MITRPDRAILALLEHRHSMPAAELRQRIDGADAMLAALLLAGAVENSAERWQITRLGRRILEEPFEAPLPTA